MFREIWWNQVFLFGVGVIVVMIILLISLKILSGDIIKKLKENGYEYTWGNATVKLAEAYGFCWGVERAVQIAYEARKQFPDEKIWITSEILHSPPINKVFKKQNQYFFYNIFNLNIFAPCCLLSWSFTHFHGYGL